MKKLKKIKWKNLVLLIIFLLCIGTLIYSVINIIDWEKDNKGTKKVVDKINEEVEIKEVEDSENTEIIEQENVNKNDPYWDYIKMSLINVDFSELKNTNDQTKGWIKVNGTNINYPFVQATDNKFYLTHSFDKSYNKAGWVFMDYRNDISTLDKNTILYAHGRVDTTMFGSLKNILKSNWYNTSTNRVIKLSTETENTLWQVFSVYRIETTSDYIQIAFGSDQEYQALLDKLKSRSYYDFYTNVSASDKILTLSTCYNTKEKVVMHAKLIKREAR